MNPSANNSNKRWSRETRALSAEGLAPICGINLGTNETTQITARNVATTGTER
jgi:hypothetical protein